MRSNRKISNLAFVDMLLLLLIVALTMIAIPQPGELDPRAVGLITLEWKDESNNDVDVWIRTPDGQLVGYRNKDIGYITLVRDDTGFHSGEGNHESVEFYSMKDGTYVVNLHMYHMKTGPDDVTIRFVTFDRYNKHVELVITLTKTQQERTAFTFTVEDGKVVDVDETADVRIVGTDYGADE